MDLLLLSMCTEARTPSLGKFETPRLSESACWVTSYSVLCSSVKRSNSVCLSKTEETIKPSPGHVAIPPSGTLLSLSQAESPSPSRSIPTGP